MKHRSFQVYQRSLGGASLQEDIVRCLEIVPRVVVQNDTGQLVEFRRPERCVDVSMASMEGF